MSLQLALNLSTVFTELPLLERFQCAADAGFRGVEIQFPYDIGPEAIATAAARAGVDIVLINAPAGDLMTGGPGLAGVPAKVDEFEQALTLCESYIEHLNPECINILAGRADDSHSPRECLDTFAQNLRRAAQRFRARGVTTVFEAINRKDMPGFLIASSDEQLALLRQLRDAGVRLQVDVYHLATAGEIVADSLARTLPHAAHIQFADVPGRGEPGSGEIDFCAIVDEIKRSDYQGWLSAEYRPTGPSADSFGWLESAPFSGLLAAAD